MSDESTSGEMTEQEEQGIFSEAASAAAKGESFAKNPAPAKEEPDPKPNEEPEPPASKEGAKKEAATDHVVPAAPVAPAISSAMPTPAPKLEVPKAEPFSLSDVYSNLSGMEFDDPASGEGAKIKAADLEKEYPSMTGYTKAIVERALEAQSANLRQEFEKRLQSSLESDPTIARIRQQEVESQTAELLETVSGGDDGIQNALDIQQAAMKADWVSKQPAHIRDMAMHSNDPRDVRFILERAASDLKIEVKRGAPQAERKASAPSDNRVIAAKSALRGTGRQSAGRSGVPQSDAEAESMFEQAAQALREGKPLPT